MPSPRHVLKALALCGVLGVFGLSGCASSLSARSGAGAEEEGLATFYGERHRGLPTASGERFNPSALTAAHRRLPFGSRVLVTTRDGQRSVVVRINDRGPYGRGRIIDLSLAAARRLEMLRAGVIPVRVRLLP